MARLAPKLISLKDVERQELEKLLSRHSTPQQIVLRAQIILLADRGKNNREIGRELNVSRFMARRWRNRWLKLDEGSIPVRERLKGIQAIERQEKDLPLRPGLVKRREFE
jgi:putative transposase